MKQVGILLIVLSALLLLVGAPAFSSDINDSKGFIEEASSSGSTSDPVQIPPESDLLPIYPILKQSVFIPPMANTLGGTANYLHIYHFGKRAATFTLYLYGLDGATAYSQNYEIEPLSTLSIDMGTLGVVAQAGKLSYTDSGLTFRLIRVTPEGNIIEQSLSSTLNSYIGFFYNPLATDIDWKGLALSNFSDSFSIITIKAFGNGEELGAVNVMIGPNQTLEELYETFFPGIEVADIQAITAKSPSSTLSGISLSGNNTALLLITPATQVNISDVIIQPMPID